MMLILFVSQAQEEKMLCYRPQVRREAYLRKPNICTQKPTNKLQSGTCKANANTGLLVADHTALKLLNFNVVYSTMSVV
jgi:hypothetical protein